MSSSSDSKTRFAFANTAAGKSFGRVGIPHDLAPPAGQCCIWSTAVPTASLTQLGKLFTGYNQMHGFTCGIGDLQP